MKVNLILCALWALFAAAAALPKDALADVVARMDQAAAKFEAMSGKVHYTTHTGVIDDTSEEAGTVMMKKVRSGQVAGRIDFLGKEDGRTVTFEQRKAQVYYPKIKTVEIYDLGKHGEQLDQFLMIGFGTTGTELARDYVMTVVGNDTIAGKATTRLELTPKLEEMKKVVLKMDLWIGASPGQPYPIREKIYGKTSGDYRIVDYSDIRINPRMGTKDMELKLPAGVKKVYPQK